MTLALAGPGSAQEAEVLVPVDLQVRIFLNALTFDRNLEERTRGELVFAVLVQRRFLPSSQLGDEVLGALRELPDDVVAGHRLRIEGLELTGSEEFRELLETLNPTVLYVSPLRALSVDEIAEATRALKIRTVTGVPDYVARGLSIGLRLRDDRPEILINREAAIAEGADLTSQLLKLARVLR
jgi:hypothetical protein